MSTVFLFPGQGSQHVGMGSDLYDRSPSARAVFDQADDLLGYSLSALCFEGAEEELVETAVQQPAIFTVSVAAWQEVMEQEWDTPHFVAGHSAGEYAALVAAQALSFGDGLALIRRRGELMKRAGDTNPGAMSAILALDAETTLALCQQASERTGKPVQIANDNCPGQLVISGNETALAMAETLAKEAGARKIVRLPISIAAHSVLMASVADEFGVLVDETAVFTPKLPIIGNVTAQPLQTIAAVRAELKAQLTSSVMWTDSMRYLLAQGADTFVEVGPGKTLLSLVKRLDRKTKRIKFGEDE